MVGHLAQRPVEALEVARLGVHRLGDLERAQELRDRAVLRLPVEDGPLAEARRGVAEGREQHEQRDADRARQERHRHRDQKRQHRVAAHQDQRLHDRQRHEARALQAVHVAGEHVLEVGRPCARDAGPARPADRVEQTQAHGVGEVVQEALKAHRLAAVEHGLRGDEGHQGGEDGGERNGNGGQPGQGRHVLAHTLEVDGPPALLGKVQQWHDQEKRQPFQRAHEKQQGERAVKAPAARAVHVAQEGQRLAGGDEQGRVAFAPTARRGPGAHAARLPAADGSMGAKARAASRRAPRPDGTTRRDTPGRAARAAQAARCRSRSPTPRSPNRAM